MIVSFRHKGLREFFHTGSTRGIQAAHAPKVKRILQLLDAATGPGGMDIPGYRLHPLKGTLKGHWSVFVNGNWRITFRFADTNAEVVDYKDYH